MISAELARQIRYLELLTTKAVTDSLAGEYRSVFKGQGIEFAEVREYQPGDDVRAIDWNVTARMGRPFVKRFVEERELTVIFVVDLSASGTFGSIRRLKNEVATEVCALLAFSAIHNHDKVGLIAFTDCVEKVVPPAKGASHVLRLIRDLLSFTPHRARTDIAAGMEYLGRVTTRRSVVFLISDFLDAGFEQSVRVIGRRHDLIAVSVTDPCELRLPDAGLLELEDAETGRPIQIDTASAGVRERYAQLGEARRGQVKALFRTMGIDQIEILTGRDHAREIGAFFRTRERRMRT